VVAPTSAKSPLATESSEACSGFKGAGITSSGKRGQSPYYESTGPTGCTTLPSGKLICPTIAQQVPTETRFAYDQQGHLLGEYNGQGQAIQGFI
jgi:hypothetical protein